MLGVSDLSQDRFFDWHASLEDRHLRELAFSEVRRGLQALSSAYVERRGRQPVSAALQGAGKRAAFALFYSPLHFLVARHAVRHLGAASPPPARIHDLGCGTGAAGAAWAVETGGRSPLACVDLHPWAIEETRWTLRWFGLRGRARRGRLENVDLTGGNVGILLAYSVNELAPAARELLLERLLGVAGRGARVLVIEPIARRLVPWWKDWASRVTAAGGRADTWRFTARLPERLQLLDRAAGLDHSELTARTLYLAGATRTGVRP
jgi:hypothetical protein